MGEFWRLLWGTVLLRPYVFAFLAVYLAASASHLGWRRTLLFLPLGYGLAWLSEFCSIHWGVPYGDYFYIPATTGRELWVAGVPFMDSLSYVFLSYCSYAMALFVLSPLAIGANDLFILETRSLRRSRRVLVLGACLFVLLDIIIDPVALQGHRWFLGQIYGYRVQGLYFGIPLSNFAGWLVVGLVLIGTLQILEGVSGLDGNSRKRPTHGIPGMGLLGPVLYLAVLIFNLAVTFCIGEMLLGLVGCLILGYCSIMAVLFTLHKLEHLNEEFIRRHLLSFPHSRARVLLPRDR
jgi:uncharacterized membrane protein